MLHRLVEVYTCLNAKLFEISCRGSITIIIISLAKVHVGGAQWLSGRVLDSRVRASPASLRCALEQEH